MAIRTSEQAKIAIRADAARKALGYIERETPSSLEAIIFWVNEGIMSADDIMAEIDSAYDITEPKVKHKFRLVVDALVLERDD